MSKYDPIRKYEWPVDAGNVSPAASAVTSVSGTVNIEGLELLAPTYLLQSDSTLLTNRRVLAGGDGVELTDGGAASTMTIAVDVTDILGTGLAEDGSNNLILPTPGTLTVATANSATAPHTHGVTSSSSPGAAASLLASDANGGLFLDTDTLAVSGLYDAAWVNAGSPDGTAAFKVRAAAVDDLSWVVQKIGSQTADLTRILDTAGDSYWKTTSAGNLESGNPGYTANAAGWQLSPGGDAEFNSVSARGEFKASVFVYGEIHADSGSIAVMDAAVLAEAFTVGGATPGTAPPTANFTVDDDTGDAPHTVNFTDASTGSITSYSWDFDNDGDEDSTDTDPTYIYTEPGVYSPKLTVTGAGGSNSVIKRGLITVTDPALPSETRVTDGLVHLWLFDETAGLVARDSAAGSKYDLYLESLDAVAWRVDVEQPYLGGYLDVTAATILTSTFPATTLIAACQATSEISIEAWIQPANTTQSGRIWSLAADTGNINAELSQAGTALDARCRSTGTNDAGAPGLTSTAGMATTELMHVVFTRSSAGAMKLYVDGVEDSGAALTVAGDFSGWNSGYSISAANIATEDRPWTGRIYLAAVYSKELSSAEVVQNFNAGGGVVTPALTPPVAAFGANVTTISVNDTVTFTDASTNTPTSWYWTFGDGDTSTSQNPNHQYTATGKFTVSLQATNADGSDWEIKVDYITVGASPPTSGYYVSPGGDNNGAGTYADPWRTIDYGVDQLSAGQTLYIMAGTYHETVTVTKNGTAIAPIRVMAYPGASPVLDGEYTLPTGTPITFTNPEVSYLDCTRNAIIDFTNSSYVTFQGLEVKRSRGRAFLINPDSSHITIQDCTAHDNRHAGVSAEGPHVTVSGSIFYRNSDYCTKARANEPTWPPCVRAYQTHSLTVDDCLIYNNWTEGVSLRTVEDCTVQNTIVGDNMRTGIYMNKATGTLVQRNLVFGTLPAFCTNVPKSIGINLESGGGDHRSEDNTVINNICISARQCFESGSAFEPGWGGLVDSTIAGNTFYAYSGAQTIRIAVNPENSGTIFKDNIIVGPAVASGDVATTGITFDYNHWQNLPPSALRGAHDTAGGDPKLWNPESNPTTASITGSTRETYGERFKLLDGSICRNAGVAVAAVTDDFWETARPVGAGTDIGAHERA